MSNPTTFNGSKILEEIRAKEAQLKDLDTAYNKAIFELQELKRVNAANITIQWKESIKDCLVDESEQSSYFLKTPAFISNCLAWTYGVEVTRDIKNKVATTLSIMFNQGFIGRIQHNGKTYYGLPKYFKTDMITLKRAGSFFCNAGRFMIIASMTFERTQQAMVIMDLRKDEKMAYTIAKDKGGDQEEIDKFMTSFEEGLENYDQDFRKFALVVKSL